MLFYLKTITVVIEDKHTLLSTFGMNILEALD